jgi:hypothetical protein
MSIYEAAYDAILGNYEGDLLFKVIMKQIGLY